MAAMKVLLMTSKGLWVSQVSVGEMESRSFLVIECEGSLSEVAKCDSS